jgi:hypothetical protein
VPEASRDFFKNRRDAENAEADKKEVFTSYLGVAEKVFP